MDVKSLDDNCILMLLFKCGYIGPLLEKYACEILPIITSLQYYKNCILNNLISFENVT